MPELKCAVISLIIMSREAMKERRQFLEVRYRLWGSLRVRQMCLVFEKVHGKGTGREINVQLPNHSVYLLSSSETPLWETVFTIYASYSNNPNTPCNRQYLLAPSLQRSAFDPTFPSLSSEIRSFSALSPLHLENQTPGPPNYPHDKTRSYLLSPLPPFWRG